MLRAKASQASTASFDALFSESMTRKTGRLSIAECGMRNADLRKIGFVGLAVSVLAMVGCQRPVADGPSPTVETRIVTDDLGRKVTVPAKITRVVSTAPSVTENVFAVGAGGRLVGVTTFCNYPEEAKAIAKVGDTLNPNMETIVGLKPDVVLVSSASQLEAFTKILETNGIAVYVTNPNSLKDVIKDIRQLGGLLGTDEHANIVAADMQHRMDDVYDKLFHAKGTWNSNHVPVPVFVQISKEPLFTIGKQSFLTDMLQWANAYSVTDEVETAYPKLSKETALALQPEAIILSESRDNKEPNDVFKNSPAVKNGRVYRIDADILSRPGPRLIDAYEQIASDLHPDKFRDN